MSCLTPVLPCVVVIFTAYTPVEKLLISNVVLFVVKTYFLFEMPHLFAPVGDQQAKQVNEHFLV